MREKVRNLKKEINFFTNPYTQLEILRNSFAGEQCYILSCGPSLLETPKKKLREKLSGKLVFTVKQAYLEFGEISSFQFFNCNNFTNYQNKDTTIIISQSDALPEEVAKTHIWKNQEYDLNFLLKDNKIKENKLAKKLNFNQWCFSNRLDRPWGPGVMSETVLFFAEHLGVSKIRTIGWDHIDPKEENRKIKHFYDNSQRPSEILFKANPLDTSELEESIELSKHTNRWLSELNVELEVFKSDKCFIHDEVKRFEL